MIRRKMICSILSYCLMLSFECGLIEGSMDDRFRAHRVEQSVSAAEQQLMNQLNADATGGNRLCCDWGEFKRNFESGSAKYGLFSIENISAIHGNSYINTVNLLMSSEDAKGIDDLYDEACDDGDEISKRIEEKFTKPLAVLEGKMKQFYYYITGVYKPSVLPPKWNRMPSVNGNPKRSTHSAVHTEFMMVYDLIQSDEGLFKLFNAFDFEELVNQLRGKLPAKIYSVKAMCPVCEAFLTSLYNVCGCEGVFISKWNDYNSPLGPDGYLRKAYIGYSKKGGTYADLPPDNRKKPAH